MNFSEVWPSSIDDATRPEYRAFLNQYFTTWIAELRKKSEALYGTYDFTARPVQERAILEGISELFVETDHFLRTMMPADRETVRVLQELEDVFSRISTIPDLATRAQAEKNAEAYRAWCVSKEGGS